MIKKHFLEILSWSLRLHGISHFIEILPAITEGSYVIVFIALFLLLLKY